MGNARGALPWLRELSLGRRRTGAGGSSSSSSSPGSESDDDVDGEPLADDMDDEVCMQLLDIFTICHVLR